MEESIVSCEEDFRMVRNSMVLFSLLPTSPNYYSGVIPSILPIMASEHLNLPPGLSVTCIIQPANEDTALFILQSILKTGAHLPAGKWTILVKLLWDSPPNPGPFYHVFRELTASGHSRNISSCLLMRSSANMGSSTPSRTPTTLPPSRPWPGALAARQ